MSLSQQPITRTCVVHEENAFAFVADVCVLLQDSKGDEATVLTALVGKLAAVGLECVVHLAEGSRYSDSRAQRSDELAAAIERHTRRAMADRRAVWCCREPIAQPHGVSETGYDESALRDLVAVELVWMLAVPFGMSGVALGAFAVYARVDGATVPSIPLARAIAELAGGAIVRRRERAELLDAIRRRESAMATIAHDIRSSLSVIWMVARTGGLSVDSASGVPAIERQVKRMQMLVADILDAAVMTSTKLTLNRTASAPHAILAEAVAFIEPLACAKDMQINIVPSNGVPHVFVDQHRLEQVLTNLLGNAIKFTPRGGRIDRSDFTRTQTASRSSFEIRVRASIPTPNVTYSNASGRPALTFRGWGSA
jgi:signal transduction histidine kinase